MAVFTAAALAVGAISLATAATAAATIATAVVAVSAAVGVVGLAVTAVGMITKNEDLLGVGKIMGYVGLAGGLAGGLIGGLGGMMEGGAGFIAGAKGAFTGAADKLTEAGGKYASFFDEAAGAKTLAPVENTVGATGVGNNLPVVNQAAKTELTGLGAGKTVGDIPTQAPFNTAGSVPGLKPMSEQAYDASIKAAAGGTISPNDLSYMQQIGKAGGDVAKTPGILDSTPDWMKYSAATAGLQGLTGAAGGYFQGQSAEEQLALQKLQNDQSQAQLQRINQNNSYAPRLTFNQPGLINR